MFLLSGGRKWIAIAAVVLAVGLVSWWVVRSIQQSTEDKITIELQEDTNEKRKEIRDAVKERRSDTSGGDDDSWGLQYLKSR